MHTTRMRVCFFAFLVIISLSSAPFFSRAQVSNVEQRAALQAELDQIEKDIANNKGTLSELQKRRTTLERDISILDTKIKNAQLQIKQTDLTIKKLQSNISEKKSSISEVDKKITREEDSLAQILRRTREIDDIPMSALILSAGSISDVFRELDEFATIERALDESFDEMAALRAQLSGHKLELEEKEDETQKVRTAQVIAKQAIQRDEAEKKQILTTTKGQENTYQQIIADKQKRAAEIRTALFGLRDSAAIPFGTAYEYAKEASRATGVRPALILAILTQESDLGKNVGSCYMTNLETGGGIARTTGRVFATVMKPSRDIEPFREITSALGRDWSTTPVSCPQGVGYGGAMGPSQFIPSTWMLYKSRISALSGESIPDPWSPRTAIFATALLMKDNGADAGGRTAERRAALKYFAGSNWNKPANAIYGDSVMDHVDRIQSEIDILGG
ncbi:MAG: Peptidase M23 [Parcubacteria group bacterium GW2011_GWA2_51_10]|nr:MAG: Peptidase M23 [Parcubacteria group bacterium GW2011_GWA2_51_10]